MVLAMKACIVERCDYCLASTRCRHNKISNYANLSFRCQCLEDAFLKWVWPYIGKEAKAFGMHIAVSEGNSLAKSPCFVDIKRHKLILGPIAFKLCCKTGNDMRHVLRGDFDRPFEPTCHGCA